MLEYHPGAVAIAGSNPADPIFATSSSSSTTLCHSLIVAERIAGRNSVLNTSVKTGIVLILLSFVIYGLARLYFSELASVVLVVGIVLLAYGLAKGTKRKEITAEYRPSNPLEKS